MPQLDDVIANREKKKFVKKNYRPWDLSGTGEKSVLAPQVEAKTEPLESSLLSSDNPAKSTTFNSTKEVLPDPIPLSEENKGSELEFKRVQKSSKKEFIRVQKGSELEFKKDQQSKKGFNKGSIRVQLDPNITDELGFNNPSYLTRKLIHKLGGNERKLFLFVVQICSKNGALSTGEIVGEDLDSILEMPRNSRETAIKRLKNKGLLIREEGRRGTHGTLSLSLSELTKIEALHYLSNAYTGQPFLFPTSHSTSLNRVQINHDNRVQLGFNRSSSSSSNNINTTTTREDFFSSLAEDWKEIEIEPLKEIGFTFHHVKQIADQEKLSAEELQNSIWAFAFDLTENQKAKTLKTAPINFFMGILKRGAPYAPPANYESPTDRARRLYRERQSELEKKRQAEEEECIRYAFEDWRKNYSEQELNKLLPFMPKSEVGRRACLLDHFRKEVWPQKCNEILDIVIS